MGTSTIEWTEQTWNPVVGCTRVSEECRACYAFDLHDMRHKAFLAGKKMPQQYAKPFKEVQLMPDRLDEPLRWRRPRMVFVNSMSDLWHDDVPDAYIAAVFGVMQARPDHTFQALTKRAARLLQWSQWIAERGGIGQYIRSEEGRDAVRQYFGNVTKTTVVNGRRVRAPGDPWMQVFNAAAIKLKNRPLDGVWVGVSVGTFDYLERIESLRAVPAAVRFLSVEPMLTPVIADDGPSLEGIDWVIFGCESNGTRVGRLGIDDELGDEETWMRALREGIETCQAADVATFVKQVPIKGRLSHDPDDWPEWARVRQFPRTEASA